MAVDLIQLVARFKSHEDVETPAAFFKTKVPSVAPEAYLHTIYKAAPSPLIREVSAELSLPSSVVDFYQLWNGARLFVNGLSVYGCVARGTLLNRSDRFKLPPFGVREINCELNTKVERRGLIAIGSYGYDRSLVCVEQQTEAIVCFVGENVAQARARWKSVGDWLAREVARISFLFDESGNRLVDEQYLLPACGRIN